MEPHIIGRADEIQILQRLLQSKQPELLALYGRRRVGKTFLIKTFFDKELVFSCSGQYLGKTNEQLFNFTQHLHHYFPKRKTTVPPKSWQEAFIWLQECVDIIDHKKKKVIFFDELPWLDNHKSGFLSSFSYFWNMYASQREDLLIIICGSAASWIIEKVINNKGGLHNRITQRIRLVPFTLKETEQYLSSRNIHMDRYKLLQVYMVMGGIPLYLNSIERGKSAAQNIDQICFSKDGILVGEFNNLYAALFNHPEKHIQVIKSLAKKNKGLTRSELLQTAKLITGGGISVVLNELLESGFIEKVYPYGKQERNAVFRLADEFSLFYLRYMQNRPVGKNQWLSIITTPGYISWGGYAFENICFKHIQQIKRKLQIGGVQSTEYSWIKNGSKDQDGAQIDLLIDRADLTINICEMKFSTNRFTVTKSYANELRQKIMVFKQQTNSRKACLLTFITTYGLVENDYMQQLVDAQITMDALFD